MVKFFLSVKVQTGIQPLRGLRYQHVAAKLYPSGFLGPLIMIKPFARLAGILSIAAVLTAAAVPAMAQTSDGRYYDKGGTSYDSQYYRFTPPGGDLSLTRPENGKPGEFTLHITLDGYGRAGCAKLGNLAYETIFEDPELAIKPKMVTVDFRNLPKAPEYQCDQRTKYTGAAIPLSTATLKDHQITQLVFETSDHIDHYDLTMDDHSVTLSPTIRQLPSDMRYVPMHLDNVKNPLKLWFYPKNTVILQVASAKPGLDVAQEVDSLARSQGLEPLTGILPDFTSPLEDPYSFYYVDKSKKSALTKQPGIKDGILFGEISLPATVYSPQGGNSANINVKVFAHTPGLYE
jgi:hypothetical protein